MKELETKLNKEYEGLGVITIASCHEEILDSNQINYVHSIMATIEPLSSDEPIVVSKYRWDEKYKLIDGYHRLKSKILSGGGIKAIVLDDYKLSRSNDTLFSFLEKTIGKTIKFIDSNNVFVNSKYYTIEDNEGCGGCSSGWSSIEVYPEFINKEIKVRTIESKDSEEKYEDDVYLLYINGNKIARVDTGYGNGYYGGDFEVKHIN